MHRASILTLISVFAVSCQTHELVVMEQKSPNGAIASKRSGYKDQSGEFVYHGQQTFFDLEGRVSAEGMFSHGLHDGEWRYWNGEDYFRGVYRDGKPWSGMFPEPRATLGPNRGIRYENGKPVSGG